MLLNALQMNSCIHSGMVANQITNCHQSIDAGSWSTAGPKTKTGEAKGETNPELICSIQFWSNVSE